MTISIKSKAVDYFICVFIFHWINLFACTGFLCILCLHVNCNNRFRIFMHM